MKNKTSTLIKLVPFIIPVVLSALGGAMMVFSGYDDSPGGMFPGLFMILLALYLALRKGR